MSIVFQGFFCDPTLEVMYLFETTGKTNIQHVIKKELITYSTHQVRLDMEYGPSVTLMIWVRDPTLMGNVTIRGFSWNTTWNQTWNAFELVSSSFEWRVQETWLKRPIVIVVVVFLSYLQLFAESDLVSRSKLTVLKSRYLDVSETDSVILVVLPWMWTPKQRLTDLQSVGGAVYLLRRISAQTCFFQPVWGTQDATI